LRRFDAAAESEALTPRGVRAAAPAARTAITGAHERERNRLAGPDSASRIRSVATITFEHVTKRYSHGFEAVYEELRARG
jgi:hypothetical protein